MHKNDGTTRFFPDAASGSALYGNHIACFEALFPDGSKATFGFPSNTTPGSHILLLPLWT